MQRLHDHMAKAGSDIIAVSCQEVGFGVFQVLVDDQRLLRQSGASDRRW